jgi:hypothetical protein
MSRWFLLIALATSFSLYPSGLLRAAEDESGELAIEKAVAQIKAARKLKLGKPKTANATTGKVLALSPCSPPDVPAGDVLIEMTTEMYAAPTEAKDVLFVEYLFCFDPTGKLISKRSQSHLVSPGSGLCGMMSDYLDNLAPGKFKLYCRISKANADGSETILDSKTCSFTVQ